MVGEKKGIGHKSEIKGEYEVRVREREIGGRHKRKRGEKKERTGICKDEVQA